MSPNFTQFSRVFIWLLLIFTHFHAVLPDFPFLFPHFSWFFTRLPPFSPFFHGLSHFSPMRGFSRLSPSGKLRQGRCSALSPGRSPRAGVPKAAGFVPGHRGDHDHGHQQRPQDSGHQVAPEFAVVATPPAGLLSPGATRGLSPPRVPRRGVAGKWLCHPSGCRSGVTVSSCGVCGDRARCDTGDRGQVPRWGQVWVAAGWGQWVQFPGATRAGDSRH